jgi:hypothetical protein
MTLRECYIEHSYYYPKLEREMSRIIVQSGLNDLGSEAIEAFCRGGFGDLRLDSGEAYKNILNVFQCFLTGVAWALRRYLPD